MSGRTCSIHWLAHIPERYISFFIAYHAEKNNMFFSAAGGATGINKSRIGYPTCRASTPTPPRRGLISLWLDVRFFPYPMLIFPEALGAGFPLCRLSLGSSQRRASPIMPHAHHWQASVDSYVRPRRPANDAQVTCESHLRIIGRPPTQSACESDGLPMMRK